MDIKPLLDTLGVAGTVAASVTVVGGALAGIYKGYKWLRRRRPAAAKPRVYLREGSPAEVMKALAGIPDLHRAATLEAAYVGKWVEWSGKLESIGNSDDHLPSQFRIRGQGFSLGVAVVPPGPDQDFERVNYVGISLGESERPAVEQLRKGDRIRFEAKLTDVTLGLMSFKDGHILEHETKAGKQPALP